MLKLIFALLLTSAALFSEDSDWNRFPLVDIEGTPNAIVGGCVNVISGDYCETQKDLVMLGAEPLIVERSYSSANPYEGTLCQGWEFNLQGFLRLTCIEEDSYELWWRGSFGSELLFKTEHKSLGFPFNWEMLKKGICNNATGVISGRTNLKNTFVSYKMPTAHSCMMHKGDGSKLIFEEIKDFEKQYRLQREMKANQMAIVYRYNEGVNLVSDVAVLNPSGTALQAIHFDYGKRYSKHTPSLSIFANDGQKVQYNFTPFIHFNEKKEKFITYGLSEVISPNKPKENYTYARIGAFDRIAIKSLPENRYRGIIYYTPGEFDGIILGQDNACMNRVRSVVAPIGADAAPLPQYTFNYHLPGGPEKGGFCAVFDALRNRKDYFWDDEHRLTAIVRYSASGAPYTYDRMYWGAFASMNHGNLVARAYFCGTEPLFCRNYHYDYSGNVTCESLIGNLSGINPSQLVLSDDGYPYETGCDRYDKFKVYSQDGMNLLLKETCGNHCKSYLYYPGTDLLGASYTLNGYDVILRHTYVYDENKSLTLEIVDNGCSVDLQDLSGVTYRKLRYITPRKTFPFGLPEKIEERYQNPLTGEEFLLKAIENFYSSDGLLLKQDHYDANRQLAYSLEWAYDALGNVTFQKNALGECLYRRYDGNGNKIFEQGARGDYYKEYFYDYCNRLIRSDEIHGVERLSTHFAYDLLGRKISTVDWYGNETKYGYDEFGNRVAEVLPAITDAYGQTTVPASFFAYDGMGRVVTELDPNGQATYYKYTARSQPCEITYPDGTQERFVYYNHGPLRAKTERNGCSTIYIRDHLDRVITTEHYAPQGYLLSKKSAVYDAIHLLSETDELGHTTTYAYDVFGRVISIAKGDSLETFEYDALSRVVKKSKKCNEQDAIVQTFVYDLLDRVLQERTEDASGKVANQINYSYDVEGNRTQTITYGEKGAQITETRYNSFGLPSETIDALGNVTRTNLVFGHRNDLGQMVAYSETIDPLGNSSIQIKDALGRESLQLSKNAMGVLTQARQMYYDAGGNRCKVIETVFSEDTSRQIINYWTFNKMGEVTGCFEALGTPEQRHTQYEYNHLGQLWKIEKPSGIQLYHSYSAEGLLEHYFSKDGSIDYVYNYDPKLRLISCKDLVQRQESSFLYDENDNLIKENLANGHTIGHRYDYAGRAIDLILPDTSSVHYSYAGAVLKKITRCTEGQDLYSHTYDAFDYCQKPLQETFLCSRTVQKAYDSKGRIEKIAALHFTETIPKDGYDVASNLRKREVVDALGKAECDYSYDSLYQLTSETGMATHQYAFDSLYNLTRKDHQSTKLNNLNQLLSLGQDQYVYDLDGNLIKSITPAGETLYTYDALDRLIAVTKNGETTKYSYDAFNRRLSKTCNGDLVTYLYDGQNEIGCIRDGKLLDFRVLGVGLGAEIGAAVAIELNGRAYTPLHDHLGNVVSLLDEDGKPAETYRYSAFGEEQIYNAKNKRIANSELGNSWRYCSKRTDDETGFVYFGRRYYAPTLSRWISKDPLGFEAGPNLYAYVANRTLIALDPYGLEGSILGGIGNAILGAVGAVIDFSVGLAIGVFNGFIDPIGTAQKIMSPPTSMDTMAYQAGEAVGQCLGLAAMAIPLFGPIKSAITGPCLTKMAINVERGAARLAAAARAAEAANSAKSVAVAGETIASRLLTIEKVMAATSESSLMAKAQAPLLTAPTLLEESSVFLEFSVVGEAAKKGARHRFVADPIAEGAHTVFRSNPETNIITHYETFKPQSNIFNPNPWESVCRFDNGGGKEHFNKVLDVYIHEPHVHDIKFPGGIRPAESWEIPK